MIRRHVALHAPKSGDHSDVNTPAPAITDTVKKMASYRWMWQTRRGRWRL